VNILVLLLKAAHFGPTLAVTVVAGLLGVAAGLDPLTVVVLLAAVFTGQLTIGWSNDLLDAARDRQVGRRDKPVATGELGLATARLALALAVAACVVLSLLLGLPAAACHLVVVASGWAYNLGLKRTWLSWLPYATAFGALPAVATLAATPPAFPPTWMLVTGALLGVGAHLVNVLPDLADDAATGVRGLPHRLGARAARLSAAAVLVLASVVATVGPASRVALWSWAALAVAVLLGAVAALGSGRTPFRAAMAIALVDVALLTSNGAVSR
jgi:4-hydroxybenzoate polyprenyltransferase